MIRLRRTDKKHIVWLLAAAVLFTRLVPLHIHVHHSESPDSSTATHAVDVHVANTASDHQHHDDTHIIDLNDSTVVSQYDLDVPGAWMFAVLLLVLSRHLLGRNCLPLASATGPPRQFFGISPPLRAPPLC